MWYSAEVLKGRIYLVSVFLVDTLDSPLLILSDTERALEVAVLDERDLCVLVSLDVSGFLDRSDLVLSQGLAGCTGVAHSRVSRCLSRISRSSRIRSFPLLALDELLDL